MNHDNSLPKTAPNGKILRSNVVQPFSEVQAALNALRSPSITKITIHEIPEDSYCKVESIQDEICKDCYPTGKNCTVCPLEMLMARLEVTE